MQQLLKKTFQIVIDSKVISYDQLTYMECVDRDNYMKSNEVSVWVRATERLKVRWVSKTDKVDLLTFYQTYTETALRWFYSKDTSQSQGTAKSLTSSYITRLAQQMNIDPITMLERYTPEAINRCSEWYIRNINAQSDKGKRTNDMKLQWMELAQWDMESDLEQIKAMRVRRLALLNNQE